MLTEEDTKKIVPNARIRDYAAGIVRAIVAIPMLAFEEIEREAERREKILKTIEDGEDGETT